jgi:hypothetical protein
MSESLVQAQSLLGIREAMGSNAYGATVDRTDLTAEHWIDHATEEAADGLLYLVAAKREVLALRQRLEGLSASLRAAGERAAELGNALAAIRDLCPGGELGDPEADALLSRIEDIARGALAGKEGA